MQSKGRLTNYQDHWEITLGESDWCLPKEKKSVFPYAIGPSQAAKISIININACAFSYRNYEF